MSRATRSSPPIESYSVIFGQGGRGRGPVVGRHLQPRFQGHRGRPDQADHFQKAVDLVLMARIGHSAVQGRGVGRLRPGGHPRPEPAHERVGMAASALELDG